MRASRTAVRRFGRDGGFTIIELAIVLTVLMIILAIIVPSLTHIIAKAKEDVLREDLRTMRKSIDQFTADKERAPATLEELVDAKYLHEIPEDPITGDTDWEVILEDEPLSTAGERGIEDVRSRSADVDTSGARRYNEY
jgi:general secretion pathway protein G